jgi:hypothetical protein
MKHMREATMPLSSPPRSSPVFPLLTSSPPFLPSGPADDLLVCMWLQEVIETVGNSPDAGGPMRKLGPAAFRRWCVI